MDLSFVLCFCWPLVPYERSFTLGSSGPGAVPMASGVSKQEKVRVGASEVK